MMTNILSASALNVEQALKMVAPQVVEQGRQLFEKGRVSVEHVDGQTASLIVADWNNQTCRVVARINGRQLSMGCSCPQGRSWALCRHRVAALLALHAHLLRHPPNVWREVVRQAVHAEPPKTSIISQGTVIFSLQKKTGGWSIVPYSLAGKHIPADLRGDQEAIGQFIGQQQLAPDARPLRSRINQQSYPNAPAEVIAAANLAIMASNPYNTRYNYSYGYPDYPANASIYEPILALLPACLVYVGNEQDPLRQRIQVVPDPAQMELVLDRSDDGLSISALVGINGRQLPLQAAETQIIVRSPLWVLTDATLLQVKDLSGAAAALVEHPQLVVPQKEEDEFLNTYLLPLAEQVPVGGALVTWEEVRSDPQPRLYLSDAADALQAQLRFGYESYEFAFDRAPPEMVTQRKPDSTALVRIYRQPEPEQEYWRGLSAYGLKRATEPGWFVLRKNTDAVDFLLNQVPRLAEGGYEVYGEEQLSAARVNRNRPTISFTVSSGIDWFDLDAVVSYGEMEVSMKELRKVIRKKGRYIKLADGSIGAIPEEWIARYRHLFALAEETDEGLRLASSHLTLLDQLLADADRAQSDEEFTRRLEHLRSFANITPQAIPQGFVGTLRPYQQAGYDWLHFLHEYGFGGCLADDMGTGKTVVTLAFLQSLRERGQAAAADLLILPRSLLFNWEREITSFTPSLRSFIHADQQRIQDPAAFGNYDLVLTTYGIALRDVELLRQYTFSYVILDESQAIKNPFAETAKAVRLLQSKHRLTLTGTPVENSTLELWSQFAFLNPGLLGSLDYFRDEFVNPIERKQAQAPAQFLRKMVYPFILRRTKDQVIADLPPRTERTLVSDMGTEQRTLYNSQRDYYRGLLLGLIEDEGINNARMKILEGLLRLRQICNHPRLVDSAFDGESAKFELLLETLETLHDEGHKALVFSQFVQMLTLVREALDARTTPYCYLDGRTRNRQAVVDEFQTNPAIPFFLISLKAGGVGLNLTAADYVIHIDPWWNPAVEMQATDRTHRIGQDKPVFVYKLVVRDSVEEKILQLQEHKRALVEQIITTEGSLFKSLTREDVEALFA